MVARELLAAGHHVAGVDNLITGDPERVPTGATAAVPRDVRDLTQIDVQGSEDLIVHCAAIARSTWPNEAELWEHNVVATQAVLGWGPPVIFASSSVVGVYPTTPYARTKTVAERLVLGRAENLALRFGNIYGPGQSEDGPGTPNVIAAMLKSRRDNGHIKVEGTGVQARHFVHVDDAAQAVVAAVESDVRGCWLDICGERTTIVDLAHMIGGPVKTEPPRQGDPFTIDQDPTPARVLLGWEPQITLADGVRAMLA